MDKQNLFLLNFNKFKIIQNFYFWIPFVIMIWPTFPSKFTVGNQLAYVIMILILLLSGLFGSFRLKFSWAAFFFGIYFIGMAIWNVVLETLRNNSEINDYLEILRPFGFLLCFQFFRYSVLPIYRLEEITYKFLIYTFFIIGLYCILEFILPQIVRPISFLLWKRESVGILRDKAIGTFFQTYNCAYAFLIPYFISFINLIKHTNIKNCLFFILMFFTQLLTQSKSMYLCVALGTFVSIFVATDLKKRKSIIKTSVFVGSMICIIGLLLFTYYDFISDSLSYAMTGLEAMSEGTSGSLNTRQAQIQWALDNNILGFFGFGVGKSQILLESLYALYYYRYGLIGLCLILGLCLYACIAARINYKRSEGKAQVLYQSLYVFFLVNPLALTSSCHQDMPKTCLLFYGMIGLIFAKAAAEKECKFKTINLKKSLSQIQSSYNRQS